MLRGRGADALDDDVNGRNVESRHAPEVVGHALLHLARHRIRARPPFELEMHDDVCLLRRARDLSGVPGQARNACHFQRRVTGVPGEHIGRDDGSLHHADRTTSSVTSGRAKSRNGTNVVPRPGDTCSCVAP